VTSDHVDHAALTEANNRAPGRDLQPIDDLALPIDDIVHRSAADRTRANRGGADPHVAVHVGLHGILRERRAVIGKLARADELHRRWTTRAAERRAHAATIGAAEAHDGNSAPAACSARSRRGPGLDTGHSRA